MSLHVDRKQYANILGPTAGDKIRLEDTEIIIEIEKKDFTHYGDEAVFGGGKTVRDGMGQKCHGQKRRRRSGSLHHRSGNY